MCRSEQPASRPIRRYSSRGAFSPSGRSAAGTRVPVSELSESPGIFGARGKPRAGLLDVTSDRRIPESAGEAARFARAAGGAGGATGRTGEAVEPEPEVG